MNCFHGKELGECPFCGSSTHNTIPSAAWAQPVQPTSKRMSRGKKVALTVVAGLVVTAAAGSFVPDEKPTASASAKPFAASARTIENNGSPREAMTAWVADNGQLLLDLSNSMDELGDVDTSDTVTAMVEMRIACADVEDTIQQAIAAPPMPIGSINTHWQAALSDYAAATRECQVGIDNVDVATLDN